MVPVAPHSVSRGEAGAPEAIEVTPEMARAGQLVLWGYDRDGDDSGATVREIFQAMEAARREPGR